MLELLWTLLRTLVSALRGYQHLVVENLLLRQQLSTFKANGRRPRIRNADRVLWIAVRKLWSRWADLLIIVKPETVVRWHRKGFRLYWSWLSKRRRRPGRRPITTEVQELIRRMETESGLVRERGAGRALVWTVEA